MAADRLFVNVLIVCLPLALAQSFCNSHHVPIEKHGFQVLSWRNPSPTATHDTTVDVDLWIDPTCPDGKAAWHQFLKVKSHLETNDSLPATLPTIKLRVHLFPLAFHSNSWKWLVAFTCVRREAPGQLEHFITAMYESYYSVSNIKTWVLQKDILSEAQSSCIATGFAVRDEYKSGLSSGVYDSPTIFFNNQVSKNEFSWSSWFERILAVAEQS